MINIPSHYNREQVRFFLLGFCYQAGVLYKDQIRLAEDADTQYSSKLKWVTTKKKRRVLIDTRTNEIVAGMGGRYNGRKISEVIAELKKANSAEKSSKTSDIEPNKFTKKEWGSKLKESSKTIKNFFKDLLNGKEFTKVTEVRDMLDEALQPIYGEVEATIKGKTKFITVNESLASELWRNIDPSQLARRGWRGATDNLDQIRLGIRMAQCLQRLPELLDNPTLVSHWKHDSDRHSSQDFMTVQKEFVINGKRMMIYADISRPHKESQGNGLSLYNLADSEDPKYREKMRYLNSNVGKVLGRADDSALKPSMTLERFYFEYLE